MAGNKNSGRRKSVQQHKLDGTFRHDRHGSSEDGLLKIPPKPATNINASEASQRRWIQNAADEHAVKNGCRFNEPLAEHICNFFADWLRFSKGEWRGKPFVLNDFQRFKWTYPLFGWVRKDGTRRFRRSYIEVPKKNYKSTWASGVGLYMLVGDLEGGSEVYSTGADRDQARIVHNEAINMVEASDEFNAALGINRTNGNISYRATQSYYRALSAAPRGKHGLNIHCAILDELHEWFGMDLWDSLRYGYRARRQPLELVITNAGNDIESVCYRQREKAQALLDGKFFDDSFFAMILSVDEDEANAEVNSVMKGSIELPVAKKCNPGLGDIIKEEDFINDIRDIIQTPSDKPNFMRLSYGVWATAVNPWLTKEHWNACGESFTEAELYGRKCFGGLDMSKTQDMTSLVLCFPDGDDLFQCLAWFWLPRETVDNHKNQNHHLYRQWEEEGWLTVTPGSTVDLGHLLRDICEIFSNFEVQGFNYDRVYADGLTQQIHEGLSADGHILVKGTGVPRIEFPQTLMTFAAPTVELERLVISGKIHHNRNPILDWQAGHVTVYTDMNNNKRPVKPKHEDHRKIDGIVALIMALAGLMGEDGTSVYETRGILTL